MTYPLYSNFSSICRICLTEKSVMKSVFSSEEIMEQEVTLCEMLMSCASVLIVRGDGLPESICMNCSQQVNAAYLFKKVCERSDTALRNCINFSYLNNDHDYYHSNISSNITIQLEDSKFDFVGNKSLNCQERNEKKFEHDYYKLAAESLNVEPNNSDESDVETDMFYRANNEDRPPDTIHANKIQEKFLCERCGKEYNRIASLKRHVSNVHENDSQTGRHKNKSISIKNDNQSFPCEICNKTFRHRRYLKSHKLIHTENGVTRNHVCNICNKRFVQMAHLKIHSNTHTGEKPFKCKLCGKGFAAPASLSSHIRIHTHERPYKCKICGKDFSQSAYLTIHIRTHTGERPIECKVCDRRFTQNGALLIHMRSHTGEKPYQCPTCGKAFAVKHSLKQHIQVYANKRLHKCRECGKEFCQRGILATHRRMHKLQAEND